MEKLDTTQPVDKSKETLSNFKRPSFDKSTLGSSVPLKLPPLTDRLLSDSTGFEKRHSAFSHGSLTIDPTRPVDVGEDAVIAFIAIDAKAKSLPWVGEATSDLEDAGQGHVIRYAGADIYHSRETGAHEVHGDIRAKYNAFGAAEGLLGLPATDETRILPEDKGRFNHFQGGSIYWTANTGPMVVRGPIRNLWSAQGWERGPLGYPTSDCVVRGGDAGESWGGFQNGAIHAKGGVAGEALVVTVSPQDLANLVRKTFDKRLNAADDDLGIEGGVNTLNVSDWGYGFWESRPRTITDEIHGFYSHGFPVVPDPTFRLELQFQFELLWRKQAGTSPKVTDCSPLRAKLNALREEIKSVDKFLTEPIEGERNPPKPVVNREWQKLSDRIAAAAHMLTACENSNVTSILTLDEIEKTLVIYLKSWRISTSGVFNGELLDQLVRKLPDSFPLAVTTIPANALLIDVIVTGAGGLTFLLAPGPFGAIRRDAFETKLNDFIESA